MWATGYVGHQPPAFLAELVEMRDGFMLRHQDELLDALAQRKAAPAAYPLGASSGALDTGMNAVPQPA